MKKTLLLLLIITTFTNVSFASFPVTEDVQTEIINDNVELPNYNKRQSTLGVISFCLSLASLGFYISSFLYNNFGMMTFAWMLGMLALVFGVVALYKKGSKSLSIIGSVLGLIESVLLLVALFVFGGIYYGN